MVDKQSTKQKANEMYEHLMKIDAFLDGLEIASKDNYKENVYKIKQEAFIIRGFLLKLM